MSKSVKKIIPADGYDGHDTALTMKAMAIFGMSLAAFAFLLWH